MQKKIILDNILFFSLHPKIPASVICFIIYIFIIIKMNVKQIHESLLTKYKKTLSYDRIRKVLFNIFDKWYVMPLK